MNTDSYLLLITLILTGSLCFYENHLAQAEGTLSAQMGVRITSIGATETIRCFVDNQGRNQVVWTHEGEDVTLNGLLFTTNSDHRERYVIKGDTENGHYNLQIKNIKPEDTGNWECKYGPAGNINTVLKSVMIVVPPDDGFPKCAVSPSGSVIRVGDPYELSCVSSGGFPAPTIAWLRDGVELSRTNTDDSLVLNRLAEQADYNVQYTCEIQSLALPTSPQCSLYVMVAPTEASSGQPTKMVSTPMNPNKMTEIPNITQEGITKSYRPTTKTKNRNQPDDITPITSISSPNASERPDVTNVRENADETDSVTKDAEPSQYMFDALAVFGLLCGVFLLILILMAISCIRGRAQASKLAGTDNLRGSTEILNQEPSPHCVRPYSTVTLDSVATTKSASDTPQTSRVFRTSYIDTKTGETISNNIEVWNPDRIYHHHYSRPTSKPVYAQVKKA